MTGFDEIAAAAASHAHVSTAQVDAHASFPSFRRTIERRRRSRVLVGVVAAALAVAAILWAVQVPEVRRAEPVHPSPARTESVGIEGGRVELLVPVTYPACRLLDQREPVSDGVARFDRGDDGGVSIFENAIPVRDRAGHRDPTAGTSARTMARWLAERPFLIDTRIVRVSVGGRPGWRVESNLPQNLAGYPGARRRDAVAPVIRSGHAFAQYGPAMGDMTFVDVPGAGVVAIWTWTNFGDLRLATEPGIRAFVAGLRFGP